MTGRTVVPNTQFSTSFSLIVLIHHHRFKWELKRKKEQGEIYDEADLRISFRERERET